MYFVKVIFHFLCVCFSSQILLLLVANFIRVASFSLFAAVLVILFYRLAPKVLLSSVHLLKGFFFCINKGLPIMGVTEWKKK